MIKRYWGLAPYRRGCSVLNVLQRATGTGLLLVAFILTSCGGSGDELSPLPEGIQTLSGVLLPTKLSLVRRGTHVLVQGEDETYFVESSVITLRKYEKKVVTLRGVIEPNIDPKILPVLVVDSIVDVESTTRDWGIRQIDLALTSPRTWQQRNQDGQVQFFVDGLEKPVLTLDEELYAGEFPLGESIVVDGNPAVRIVNESNGNQAVYVHHGNKIVTFLFTPREHPDPQTLRDEWLSVLSSVEFGSSSYSMETTNTGSLTGTPCGGPAGILCPEGSYCEVTDTENDIGVCRPL